MEQQRRVDERGIVLVGMPTDPLKGFTCSMCARYNLRGDVNDYTKADCQKDGFSCEGIVWMTVVDAVIARLED